jgi:hypothetical protein
MRVVFHLAHTIAGYLAGYGACVLILGDLNLGENASAGDQLEYHIQNTNLAHIVGAGGALVFFLGGIALVKIRLVKYNQKLQAKASSEEDSTTKTPGEKVQSEEEAVS